MESVKYPFISLLPDPLLPDMLLLDRLPSVVEIDLCENYSYSIGQFEKISYETTRKSK